MLILMVGHLFQSIGGFIVIWIVTLPLWAIGVGFVVPFVAAAFMNQQLFRYDALSEHANKQEIKAVVTLWTSQQFCCF